MKTKNTFLKIDKPEILFTAFTFLLLCFINFSTSSTGDSGDSIKHYLYAKYAFDHPEFFFHHWAKPMFVLLSSPFAYFGFKGMILFNSVCASLIGYFSYKTSSNLKIENPALVFLFLLFTPLYFALLFSGLTEYLFAVFLISGIYLFSVKKYIFGLIIISFLPLIRSEGLIILLVFAGYCFYLKEFKIVFYLLTGQVIYSLIGAIFYKDILWLIHEIPYASLKERYGSGSLFDFVHRLNYVIEKPLYLLLGTGSLVVLWRFFRKHKSQNNGFVFFLVLGTFFSVFVAHSIFWWKGIFNSMGLPRVLLAVEPSIVLLALIGTNWIISWFKKPMVKQVLLGVVCLVIIIFPFTNRDQGIVFNGKLFEVTANDIVEKDIKPFIDSNYPNWKEMKLFYTHPSVAYVMNQDYFDTIVHQEIHLLPRKNVPANSLIIWDNKMSVLESSVQKSDLVERQDLKIVSTFRVNKNGEIDEFIIFAPRQ